MFISFWNPLKAIGDTIVSFFFGVLLTLDALIYSLISWVYQIILVLCNADILSNNFEIDALVGRIYIILGVVILFLVAYSLLKSMVNPDEAMKGKKSPVTIVKDVIISVVLIAIVPTIFSFAMEFQQALLTRNTLGSIILGTSSNISGEEVSSSELIENGGMIIATGVLEAFLHPNYSACQEVSGEAKKEYPSGYNCDNVKIKSYEAGVGDVEIPFREFWKNMQENNNIFAIVELNNDALGDGKVTYYWIISTVAGVFVLFVLIQYCFDIAVRAVKLAVYELMAPIPILARIMPNEQGSKVFSNWLKATISTFVEVFIRLAILFFAVLIIKIVVQNFPSMLAPLFNGEGSWTVALFAQMFLILGIILFVKQAPEIIKEITGLDGGKYGKSLMRGIGMVAAGFGGGATAAIRTMANDTDNKWDKNKSFVRNMANKFKQAGKGGVAGANAFARGAWTGGRIGKYGEIPKAAGKAASGSLDARAKSQAAGGFLKYKASQVGDMYKDAKGWASGGFEAQQKMLEQLSSITKEADTIKTNTEGAVKDKKYVFSMKTNGDFEDITYSGGSFRIDDTTSLSAVESIVKTLQGTGDANDAKIADRLENDIQIRAKTIGKELTKVASGILSDADFERDNIVKGTSGDVSTLKFGVRDKVGVEINQATQSFATLKDRIADNPTIATFKSVQDKQAAGKVSSDLSAISMDQASDLSDAIKIQSATIQREIALEQERRKAKEKK
jgi:hypothetical protein